MKKVIIICAGMALLGFRITGNYPERNEFNPSWPHISKYAGDDKWSLRGLDGIAIREAAEAAKPGDYRLWYEDGSGNFFTQISNGISIAPDGLARTHHPFMLASVLYENPRRPPGSSARLQISNGAQATVVSPQLEAGRSIALFQNVRQVVSGDPMVFAISYKLAKTGVKEAAYRILLKYNQAGEGIAPVFEPLTLNGSTDCPEIEAGTDGGSYDISSNAIPNIRLHGGETAACYDTNSAELPRSYFRGSAAGDSDWSGIRFTNILALTIPDGDTSLHNVFITCQPRIWAAINESEGQPVKLEAVLQTRKAVKTDNDAWQDVEVSRIDDQMADSHDPNKVTVTPKCMELPQRNTSLHYRIDFHNTGMGDADGIIALFHAPEQMNPVNPVKNIQLTCGGRAINLPDAGKFSYEMGAGGKTIVFKVNDLLKGAYVPNPEINPLTMGSIDFDMDIVPGPDVNQPVELKAWVQLFFHSVNGNRANDVNAGEITQYNYPAAVLGFEKPVPTNTEMAACRKSCKTEPVNEKQKNGSCRRAWLFAVLLILAIFVCWLLFRKGCRNRHAH